RKLDPSTPVLRFSWLPDAHVCGLHRMRTENMHHLLRNVVILAAPDYVDRGWCVYEYFVACLTRSIVCDEVQDTRFVALRNWVATRARPAANVYHDGDEALSANFISQAVLGAANELASLLPSANFSLEKDRSTVKRLLLKSLELALPRKRDHDPYVGESTHSSWTEKELEAAFDAKLPIPSLKTTLTDPFTVVVPSTLGEASIKQYSIEIEAPLSYRIFELTGGPHHKLLQFLSSKAYGKIEPS
ncbi:hypothetical protein NKH33_31355, partial [Mesorhizobium sp. M1182]|uniref:hypothetical protein n=1 Tax=Mesorhizobium sp. M1182 TaxID=2957067 RepID=UPI003339C2D2